MIKRLEIYIYIYSADLNDNVREVMAAMVRILLMNLKMKANYCVF